MLMKRTFARSQYTVHMYLFGYYHNVVKLYGFHMILLNSVCCWLHMASEGKYATKE